jgi:cell division protease FtsH
MFVGVGAQRVRDAFAIAKKASPAILFIDEIDAIGRQRGAGLGGGNDEREQTLNQILVEMDGFEKDTNIIILAATNRPDVLDPALLRPGRFDRRVVLDLPDVNDRQAILEIHSKGKPIAKETDFHVAAQRTAGFSGADLANLMNEAAILTARRNKKEVGQNEILESIEKVMLGPERRSRAITPKEKELTAYHEAGHALVATTLKDSDPVHKVSIVSRGFAGGYTMKLPAEEEHLRTKTQFLNDIAVMMGGFASEKIIFKDISTGASNDLKHATETARKLVTKYGMSDLGPIVFGETEELIFLGREIATDKNYSEAVAVRIDEEVKKLIERGLHAAEKIIAGERKALDAIAHALLEKETLERDEFEKIVEPFKLKSQAV